MMASEDTAASLAALWLTCGSSMRRRAGLASHLGTLAQERGSPAIRLCPGLLVLAEQPLQLTEIKLDCPLLAMPFLTYLCAAELWKSRSGIAADWYHCRGPGHSRTAPAGRCSEQKKRKHVSPALCDRCITVLGAGKVSETKICRVAESHKPGKSAGSQEHSAASSLLCAQGANQLMRGSGSD